MTKRNEIIVLGGGCFWCTEAAFRMLRGVISVTSGYAGGSATHPTYEDVSSGSTGHAEVVMVVYDANEITLEEILSVFFTVHDPTTLNRQGSDIGTQYRSIILYSKETEREKIMTFMADMEREKIFDQPIVTEVKALDIFYPAESEHARYYERFQGKPYCQIVIAPKLVELRKKFQKLIV